MSTFLAELWKAMDVWRMGLLMSGAIIAIFIYRASRDEKRPFRFGEVFMEDGKTSLKHVAAMGAFFVSSWVVLHQETNARLTAEVFGIYMFGWVFAYTAPKVVEKWKSGNTSVGATTGTTEQQGGPKT